MEPYSIMADAAWSRLERACDDPSHPMRLVVLATVQPDGMPAARIMVLRGMDRARHCLWFHTDLRSHKVWDLRKHPAVAILAWDGHDRVQLRVTGTATVEDRGELVERHFGQISMGAHALFLAPDAPGKPLNPDPRMTAMAEAIEAEAEDWARRNFAVIEVHVDAIEWLQVEGSGQCRAIMRARSGWAVEPLIP